MMSSHLFGKYDKCILGHSEPSGMWSYGEVISPFASHLYTEVETVHTAQAALEASTTGNENRLATTATVKTPNTSEQFPDPYSVMNQPGLTDDPDLSLEPLCTVCGQNHSPEENHFYTYTEDVDDDLICHICLQALLDPLDTPCGHTYCTLCLTNFLVEKDFCPVDRKPVVLQHCKKSSILVNKLLNKLLVTCPFTEHCTKVLQRCDLQHHFQTRLCHVSAQRDSKADAASSSDGGDHEQIGLKGRHWAEVVRRERQAVQKMKALLLLVLPWLSPANYIDNVGNLNFLYSELPSEPIPEDRCSVSKEKR
ncbi:hypothetical protein STEG23_023702 [Scotinomys teguina]